MHQVKKSKKWNCKMCGEKQSIIKVFGCGSGIECRRHVQKLNTRRGEILEEQNQKAWSLGEKAEHGDEDELQDKSQEYNHNTAVETQVSRWSKYLQEPGDEEAPEEEEEDNVYMDRNQNPTRGRARKRKRGQGGRRCQSREEDDGTFQNGWRSASRSAKTLRHDSWSPGSFTPMERSSKALALNRPVPTHTKPPPATSTTTSKPLSSTSTVNQPPFDTSVTYRRNTTTSQPGSSGNNISKTSKWAQFITIPSPEDDAEEDEEEDESHWGIRASESSSLLDNREGFQVQDVSKAAKGHPGYGTTSSLACISSSLAGISSSLAGLGDGSFLKRSLGTLNRVKSTFSSCGLGEGTNREACPAQGLSLKREEPVCHQAPPTKRPCPSLPVTSLFSTEEDFDDTF